MPVFNHRFRQELLERANLCESNKIDAAWITGVRKSWKQAIEPAKKLAARSPHHETKIDINRIYKTADESMVVLQKVQEYLSRLRQDLLFNKGLWTASKLEKGMRARSNIAAKVVHELDAADKAIVDNIDTVKHWKEAMTPGEARFQLDGGRMHSAVMANLDDFNRMLNSVLPNLEAAYTGVTAADAAISKRLLGALSSWLNAWEKQLGVADRKLPSIEPETVHLGKVTVIFKDTPSGSPSGLSIDARKRGDWRLPHKRKDFIQHFSQAQNLLRQHGLEHLWYGNIFVLPRAIAPENMYGSRWGVGAGYNRSGDVVRVFSDPSEFTSKLIIHELAHRYWYKFMSAQERHNFGKWFGQVPAATEYGKVDTVEDFAEVFAWYVTGQHLNKAQISRLKTFFGRKHKLESIKPVFCWLKELRLS